MTDLRAFARELVADMERDLGTKLDWIGVDHCNTDNPHFPILVHGEADDGRDLVITGITSAAAFALERRLRVARVR